MSIPSGPIVLERQTTPERIAAVLRKEIAERRLLPGTRLIEAEYTKLLGVARHTFREAVSLLVNERLLTRSSFKGVEVTRLTGDDVRDIYTARRAIEVPAVLKLAGEPAILRSVRRAIREVTASKTGRSSQAVHDADRQVHLAIVAAHQSRRLSDAHAALMSELNVLLFTTYDERDISLAIERHGAFDELVASGRFAEASAQLDDRLLASEQQIVAMAVLG